MTMPSLSAEKVETLVAAVAAVECLVGTWRLLEDEDMVWLAWAADIDELPGGVCFDAPWADWGGDRILELAGVCKPDPMPGNAWVDSGGGLAHVYCCWAREVADA